MKHSIKPFSGTLKPRTMIHVFAGQRKAGAHVKSNKTQRRSAKVELSKSFSF
jgi:hypothetical protein